MMGMHAGHVAGVTGNGFRFPRRPARYRADTGMAFVPAFGVRPGQDAKGTRGKAPRPYVADTGPWAAPLRRRRCRNQVTRPRSPCTPRYGPRAPRQTHPHGPSPVRRPTARSGRLRAGFDSGKAGETAAALVPTSPIRRPRLDRLAVIQEGSGTFVCQAAHQEHDHNHHAEARNPPTGLSSRRIAHLVKPL